MTTIIHQIPIIGSDISFSKNIYTTIKNSIDLGMYSLQFFMGSPQSFTRTKISDEDIKNTNTLLSHFPMNVFTHFPYVCNLAGNTKDGLAWNNNISVDAKLNIIIESLNYELSILSKLNTLSSGVVIHPGSYPDRKKGLSAISKTINKLSFTKSKLLLEICAGEGNKLCKNFEELKQVYDDIIPENKKYIGFCIDTCHIFASGLYDLRNIPTIDKMFSDFDNILGLSNLSLIHLNDSCHDYKTCKDRHENLLEGYIWNKTNLTHFLKKCTQYNIPIVLETTPKDLYKTYELNI